MDYSQLLASLKQTFLDQDKYFFDRHIPEIKQDGKFLGDYFNELAVEPLGANPPRFYHAFSPFDTISNKAPEYAVVFQAGEKLLDLEFTNYVFMRTAAMNALVLRALGVENLADKEVLMFGAGRIAAETVKILAGLLSLTAIDVISKSGDLSKIKQATEQTGISINDGNKGNIGQYDVVICHTQSTEPVISNEQIASIKQGALLTSFISSTEHGEFPDEVYDQTKANIITDWKKSLLSTKDLARAKEVGLFDEPIYLKELLQSADCIDENKQYTVYRSTGTPIQNMATMKVLLDDRIQSDS